MLVKVEFKTYDDGWKLLTDEGYQELRSVVPELQEEKPSWDSREYLVDLELLNPVLSKYNLSVELHPTKNNMFVTLRDRVNVLESEHRLLKRELLLNGGMVQVHVPNIGLIAMDEVQVLENACTDVVQEALDEGWRILAVCPPNAQRRPDYIMGRSGRRNA